MMQAAPISPEILNPWARLLGAGTLLMVRLGGVIALAPPLNSPGIPPRIKVGFLLALTILLAPIAAGIPKARVDMEILPVLGEMAVGLLFGFSLSLLNEALLFAGSLLGISFSFSLANLLDPNSRVDTPVLGILLNWFGILVLFGAGLDRLVLAAVMRSLAVVPLGCATMHLWAVHECVAMISGVFFAGLQLATPVMAAAIAVEVTVALVSRFAPALPAQVVGIPIKTIVSYVVLIGSLAIWPGWIERHFSSLLDEAQRMVAG
jgi:flagellar biosynthesis protein FliR